MNKEVLIIKLKALSLSDEPEVAHKEADNLLLGFIDDETVTKAFKNIKKWYS